MKHWAFNTDPPRWDEESIKSLAGFFERNRDFVVRELGEGAGEMMDVFPIEDFVRVLERFGGKRVYIPGNHRPALSGSAAILAADIGEEVFENVRLYYGDESLDVPSGQVFLRKLKVLFLSSFDFTAREIARKVGIHQRTVYEIRRLAKRHPEWRKVILKEIGLERTAVVRPPAEETGPRPVRRERLSEPNDGLPPGHRAVVGANAGANAVAGDGGTQGSRKPKRAP